MAKLVDLVFPSRSLHPTRRARHLGQILLLQGLRLRRHLFPSGRPGSWVLSCFCKVCDFGTACFPPAHLGPALRFRLSSSSPRLIQASRSPLSFDRKRRALDPRIKKVRGHQAPRANLDVPVGPLRPMRARPRAGNRGHLQTPGPHRHQAPGPTRPPARSQSPCHPRPRAALPRRRPD